jgi:hypothetical protein
LPPFFKRRRKIRCRHKRYGFGLGKYKKFK